ncbi:MAG: TIGR03032 family protein [Sumerlaeia bacterium]
MNSTPNQEQQAGAKPLIRSSPELYDWLEAQHCSLAITTYKNSRLFLVGRNEQQQRIAVFERLFAHAMGIWTEPNRLILASQFQIFNFENIVAEGEKYKDHDKLYVPNKSFTTGLCDAHDLVKEADGRIVFVNTLFSCLCTLSQHYSFKPVWIPPFISELKPEDRCHMNGLALRDGEIRYISAVSQSNTPHGWRKCREQGGILMDVKTNMLLAEGLSMPHSPRFHQGKLWLLQSGTGELGFLENGKFQPVAFLPGYLRGLAFVGEYAVVGLSKCRQERSFQGLSLDESLKQKNDSAKCGIQIINIITGNLEAWLEIDSLVEELYDVQIIPGVKRPQLLGFRNDEIQRIISIESIHTSERESVLVLPPQVKKQRKTAP